MKKIVIFSLIITLLFSLAAPALAVAAPFSDVYDETTRFETDICACSEWSAAIRDTSTRTTI